jgi:PKHD-type hydroxylase
MHKVINNNITTVTNFLTETECKEIIQNSLNEYVLQDATVYSKTDIQTNYNPRKSKVAPITTLGVIDDKIFNEVNQHILIEDHKLSINGFQFTQYEVGDYFDWHSDSNNTVFKDRICTIVIQLNNDYGGGEFQLRLESNDIDMEFGVGNLFIFPSNIIHRVKPITSGIRYSLVSWLVLHPNETNKKRLI